MTDWIDKTRKAMVQPGNPDDPYSDPAGEGNSPMDEVSPHDNRVYQQPFDYPDAARSIALNLQEFCDESLLYPEMIADAARKAAAALATERARLDWITSQSSAVFAAELGSRDCVVQYLPVDENDLRPASVQYRGEGWQGTRGRTPREAIDAAIRAASTGKP